MPPQLTIFRAIFSYAGTPLQRAGQTRFLPGIEACGAGRGDPYVNMVQVAFRYEFAVWMGIHRKFGVARRAPPDSHAVEEIRCQIVHLEV